MEFLWGRSQDGESKTKFTSEATPVSETMLWICEKCGFKLVRDGEDSPARAIQKAMKQIISDNKQKRQVRSMVTSCMNVCPSGKIAAGIVDLKGGKTRFLSFELKGATERIAADLYKQI